MQMKWGDSTYAAGTTGFAARIAWALIASLAVAGLGVFVYSHPYGPLFAISLVGAFIALIAARFDGWLVVVPGLVPVVDLAGWTGAIHFTESDALILSVLAVCGFRQSTCATTFRSGRDWRFDLLPLILAVLMLLSYVVSTSWTPLVEVWSDPALLAGYSTPLNGVRVAKGFLWALLLLPLLVASLRARPKESVRSLVTGVLLGLLLVSLAAVWERAAFPGLSNFSSDYRTTAMFWEANVGGAALDGWLALATPFVLWAVLRDESAPYYRPVVSLVLALAAYACFTTFTRALYVGIAFGGGLTCLLMFRHSVRAGVITFRLPHAAALLAFVVIFGILLAGVFQTGGYRGMMAICGLAGAVFLMAPVVSVASLRSITYAILIATAAAATSLASMLWVPKGVYLIYALSLALVVIVLFVERAKFWFVRVEVVAIACLLWLAFNAVLVSGYWAENNDALPAAALAGFLLCFLVLIRFNRSLCWRPSARSGTVFSVVLGGVAMLVVTFNTYYASERFGTLSEDLSGRIVHWTLAASLPKLISEQMLGVGVGQFSERFFWQVPEGTYPGGHRVVREDGLSYLQMTGARGHLDFGEIYRVSQRISPSLEAPLYLALSARAPEGEGPLHMEVCRKHLLYADGCTVRTLKVPAGRDWSRFEVVLGKERLGGGGGWLPRLTVFSVANANRGRLVEIDDISLIDAQGRVLLHNGDFSANSDFWFFSSDRFHLPWHAKNLWIHYFAEQGWLGLAAFGLLSLVAFFRVAFGRARNHPLAPPLAGGLAAFFVVGVSDSLLDVPRLAVFFFILVFFALGLRSPKLEERNP